MTHSTRFVVVFLLVIVLISGWGLTAASADALPGDALYPVKTSLENLRLTLTSDPVTRQQFQQQLEIRRQEEVQLLLQTGQKADVCFTGLLTGMTDTVWTVGGLPVALDNNTTVLGQPILGANVYVEARTLADGTLLATQIEVTEGFEELPVHTPIPEPSVPPNLAMNRPTNQNIHRCLHTSQPMNQSIHRCLPTNRLMSQLIYPRLPMNRPTCQPRMNHRMRLTMTIKAGFS